MDRRNLIKRGAAAGAAIAASLIGSRSGRAFASEKTIKWRMVTSWPPAFPILQTGAERFARRVAELTNGRLAIQVYAGGELVPALGVFDAVSSGSVQCGHSAAYYWAGKCNAAQWFTSIPFGMDAQGMNAWFYFGNGLKLWEQAYDPFNLVPRPAGNTGVQMGGWFNKKINSMADFKAGGAVVLLPAGEIYTSLERGVMDATEWVGPCHDIRMGFYKVAKYYYYPGWHEPGSTLELIFNKQAYNALPKDIKEALDTAAAELNVQMLSEFERENAAALAQLQKTHKVQLLRFPDSVLKNLKALAEETISEAASKDSLSTKVNEDFMAFKKQLAGWNKISEKSYYDFML